MPDYDLVVIGTGSAGLTAGLFGARYGLRTTIFERILFGGQITNAEFIENYPGPSSLLPAQTSYPDSRSTP